MKRTALIALTLVLVAVNVAEAQNWNPRAHRWSASLQTRYTPSQSFGGNQGSGVDFQDALGWGFGFDYFLSDKFSLGGLFSWRHNDYSATTVSADDPDDIRSFGGTMTISTIGLTGMWLPLNGKWTPYANGGVGWTIVNTNIPALGYTGCYYDPWLGYVCGAPATYGTDAASFELGAGVHFQAGQSFFLRAGYAYQWLDVGDYSGTSSFRFDLGGIF